MTINERESNIILLTNINPNDEAECDEDMEEILTMDKGESTTPIQDINKVFEECKFGRFHMRLLCTTFFGFIASILVTNTTSYLLPIAECDLDMDLKQKGILTAIPFFGILIATVISGFLIDTFGRILFLKIGYGGLYMFTLLSALSQNYVMFATAKFGEGILCGIANSGIMPITSEFCHPSVRDRILLFQSAFGAMAQIICPAMAWAILMQDWEWSLFDGTFVLKTWNFFLFAMSLWSLIGYILYTTLPESPKFLVTRNQYVEARKVLIKVYTENTGKPAYTFPYPHLWNKEIMEQNKSKATNKNSLREFGDTVLVGLRNLRPLIQKPLVIYFFIIGVMLLMIVGIYDVLRLWFPQLSTIVENHILDESNNLCVLIDNYTNAEHTRISDMTVNSTSGCQPHISGTETYVNSIIIGLVCIIPYFVSGVIVNKVGKKCLLITSAAICIGGILGIRWATSKIMMVSLFSLDVAVLQAMKSLAQMVLLEVFPTTIRSLSLALVTVMSRIGTLVGNVGFPILLDMGCEVPFYVMTTTITVLIVLASFTPKKKES